MALVEAYTIRFHLRATIAQGVVGGVFSLNAFIARKELGADRWQILALLMVPALAQLVAVVWNPANPGRRLGRRPFRNFGTWLHLLPLVFVLAGGRISPTVFVAVMAFCSVGQALLVPIQNAILSGNYAETRRSRRFATAGAYHALAIGMTSLVVGWLLDDFPYVWPVLYAVAVGAAAFAYTQWGKLRRRRPPPPPPDLASYPSPWKTLWRDRRFLAFEGAFMVYGLGFLAMQPVMPLFLNDELGLGYREVALAQGVLFYAVLVACTPLVGRIGERFGVLRLGALGFLCLGVFALLLSFATGAVGVWLAYAVFGIAMSCVHVAWNLGPIVLARGRDPLPYLNAHVGVIGIRALIGMTAGTTIHAHFGSQALFRGIVVVEIVAAVMMFLTARGMPTGNRLARATLPAPLRTPR